jgi:hypothetical protein
MQLRAHIVAGCTTAHVLTLLLLFNLCMIFCNCKLQEVEDESDVADGGLTAAAKAACASRDDVISVLSALLSMHLVQQQVCVYCYTVRNCLNCILLKTQLVHYSKQ